MGANPQREERRMPFDGTPASLHEPYRDKRSPCLKVRLALLGWRPIERCEFARGYKCRTVAFLRLLFLLGTAREEQRSPRNPPVAVALASHRDEPLHVATKRASLAKDPEASTLV